MNGIYQVKKERLKELHGIENNIVSQFHFFSIRRCTNLNNMFADLLHGAMPIQDSSIKDELIDELELYGAMPMPMQYSSDPDLCRNVTEYKYSHRYRDAAEIMLHFINK